MKSWMPGYMKRFWGKMGIFVLLFTLSRLVFLLFNQSHFPVVYFTDFLTGFWFDIITTAIIFLPILIIEVFPNKWRAKKWFQVILATVFFVFLSATVLMNLADIEYYKFTSSRLTASTFTMLSYGNDLQQQLPSFIRDYWYVFGILILFLSLAAWLYKRLLKIQDDSKHTSWLKQSLYFIGTACVLVLLGRGVGLRPIDPLTATAYTIDRNVPLVLNSAFTAIKSFGQKELKEKEYYANENELNFEFNPVKKDMDGAILDHPNVVIIMLESFSNEFIASINGSEDVNTPFLDSLIGESLVFTNCYANGKKSIDAVPSIVSSIPKLMDNEFITSTYATNRIESLPKSLHKMGYESAFFHGATNGSMNFDQFASKVDFDHYYGRNEYNNESDFDGTWGIFDEPFFKWSTTKMNDFNKPFFATIFSLSSHPPYTIPEAYTNRFNRYDDPMKNAVEYSDYALSQFFKAAQQYDWYRNTLFIITADHTPASGTPEFFSDMGNMYIPLVFYHPTDTHFQNIKTDKIVAQIDIMPTILDLVGYPYSYYAYGQSIFQHQEGISVSYVNNKYLIYGKNHLLTFQNEAPLGLYLLSDRIQSENRLMQDADIETYLEKKLKAYIQRYHHDLIHNQMTAEDYE